jgi:alkylhydroperoxidase family enzyme
MLDRLVARAASLVTKTEPPRLFTELGAHPRLFRAWLPFGATLLLRGELLRGDTELVVLRTAYNSRCEYEWVQHVRLAERAGLSLGEIAAVPDGEAATIWTWRQRLLLRATDELHDCRRIDPATRDLLEHVLSDRQILELCLLVGHYEMLAMVLNTRGTEPEPGAASAITSGRFPGLRAPKRPDVRSSARRGRAGRD